MTRACDGRRAGNLALLIEQVEELISSVDALRIDERWQRDRVERLEAATQGTLNAIKAVQ